MPEKPFIYQLKDTLELVYRDGITRILDWQIVGQSLTGRFLDGNELFSFEIKADSVSYAPEQMPRKDTYLVGFLAQTQGLAPLLVLDSAEYWTGYLAEGQARSDKQSLCKVGRSCGEGCVSRDKSCRVNTPQVKRAAAAVLNRSKSESFKTAKSPEADRAVRAKEDEIRLDPKESAYIYDMQGNLLVSKNGDQTSVYFTPAEMAKMKGSIITHNHPAGVNLGFDDFNGGSFSQNDWECAATVGASEIRAVGPEGRYSLTPPKEGWSKEWWQSTGSPTYKKHNQIAYIELVKEIQSGKIAPADADLELAHRTSERTAKELGVKYTREPNKITAQDKEKILSTVPKKKKWGW